MPASLSKGQVIVTLSCSTPTGITFPRRRILLSNQKQAVSIGRASKRSSTLEPRMYNGWFDAPVMSRQHAELMLDSQSQKVFVRDVGSLHGTFHNGTQLGRQQSQAICDGDLLKFGINIDRGQEQFPQCSMKVGLEFGTADDKVSSPRPTVFRVPDETDCEDSDIEMACRNSDVNVGDDYDEALDSSMAALRKNGLELTEFHGFDTSDPIDLISEPDLVSEDNIVSSSSPTSEASDDAAVDDGFDFTLGGAAMDLNNKIGASEHETSIVSDTDKFEVSCRHEEGANIEIGVEKLAAPGAFPQEEEVACSHSETPAFPRGAESEMASHMEENPPVSDVTEKRDVAMHEKETEALEMVATAADKTTAEDQEEEVRATVGEDAKSVKKVTEKASPAVEKSVSEKVVSRKRKADLISDVVTTRAVQTKEAATENLTRQSRQGGEVAGDADGDAVFKRIRLAAEYFGVAAIGGAAVMTALIVTAPNF